MMASTSCSRIDAQDQILIADVADDERGTRRDRPAEAGRQVVEDDDLLAGVEQLEHHVAADVAGSAGDQDAHMRFRS